MKINFVRLQDFRNVEFAEVPLDADSVWISGRNAQGKTNLLEAVGLLSALRSFRTPTLKALVRERRKSAAILASVEHETLGTREIQIEISDRRRVLVDGIEVEKFADYIGKYPALAMSCDDIKILRGAPEIRRKDSDMFMSSIDADFFAALRAYFSALDNRNALLKADARDPAEYEPFENAMARAAETVSNRRAYWFAKIGDAATARYAILARENGEASEIRLKTPYAQFSADDFSKMFAKERDGDLEMRMTRKGPHRDDFQFSVAGRDAKLYASEGQQRSAVLALKLAQFEILKAETGIEPAVLCDDVLGELDSVRRQAFWECLPPSAQVIATSTAPAPCDGRRQWLSIEVSNGKFERK